MKIRLLVDVPVGTEHGLTAGRVMECTNVPSGRNPNEMWVLGNKRKAIRVMPHECEVLTPRAERFV